MSLTKLLRDFPIIPHFVVPLLLALAVCGALGGWVKEHDKRVVQQAEFVAKLQHERDNTIQATIALAKAGEALKAKGDGLTVTRTKWRTIRDTLPVTEQNIPIFIRTADDAVQRCTEYQNACETYKHVSDSLVASLRRQVALNELRIAPKLPRFRLTADALYDPTTQTPAMGAGLEFRVAGPAALTVQGFERFGDPPRLYVGVRGVF